LTTSAATAPRLHAEALACRRGLRLLFKDLNLAVEPGQIVWLRGHNGRGKTSLLRLVAGLSSAEHGEVMADGVSVRKSADFRERLVFIGHHNALKDDLTVTEALQFLLRIHGRPSDLATAHAALATLDMGSRRNAFVRTLSQGQRRRVALARLAVEPGPSLWVLDEPFDALDVDGIARLNDLLEGHAARGGSVLLTSHLPLDTARLSPTEIHLDAYAAAPR
jgi:heme exporter protein A